MRVDRFDAKHAVRIDPQHDLTLRIQILNEETSGNRVFSDLGRAKRWAARQEKSAVVKKCRIEPFVREPYRWRETRSMSYLTKTG